MLNLFSLIPTVELSYIVFKKDENSVILRGTDNVDDNAFIYLDNNDKLSKNKKKDVIQIEKLFLELHESSDEDEDEDTALVDEEVIEERREITEYEKIYNIDDVRDSLVSQLSEYYNFKKRVDGLYSEALSN